MTEIGSIIWPQHKLWGRGSERPAAHTQQKINPSNPLRGSVTPDHASGCYFRLACLIFATSLISESLVAQTNNDGCLVLFSPHPPSIEYRSDDVIKMKFLKLWDLFRYSERTTSKTPTRQKLAIRGKLSLRY